MSIDNSLGMALFSRGLNGTTAIGAAQDMANSTAEGAEGSLFQQMIFRMLAKNQTAAEAGEITGEGQNQINGNGDMLSELLLSGGSLTKLMILKGGKAAGELAEAGSLTEESKAENGQAVESLQALMTALTGTVSVSKTETIISETQTVSPGLNPQISSVGAAWGASANSKDAASGFMQEGSLEELTNTVNKTARMELTSEKTELPTGRTLQTEASAFSGMKNTVAGETDFLKAVELESLKVQTQGSSAGEAVTVSGTGNKTIADGNQVLGAMADSSESLNPKRSETAGSDPYSPELRNFVQGAPVTGEAAELNQAAQPVEANEPYVQIRNEILTKLEKNGPTEFKMQLEPENLGQIDIKLRLSEGKLIIDILAANATTQALLSSQVDKLILGMGLQNVQIETVQVSQQLNSQTQDSSQGQGFTMNSAMDFSQRKQQEQMQQQFAGNGRLSGSFSLLQSELQDGSQINHANARNGFSRMNYVV